MTEIQPIPDDSPAEDTLLGGRVRLAQPGGGYRVAVDPVLLAAFTAARDGETVLDLGTGSGAAALCLAVRVPGVRVVGLEAWEPACAMARHNTRLNGLGGRVRIVAGDLLRPPPDLADGLTGARAVQGGPFDRVMANPPYLRAGAATPPPDPWKAAANVEGTACLSDWVAAAAALLRPRGWFTMVHRADRVDEILGLLHGPFGAVTLFPLWPKAGEPARRILVAAQRGATAPARLLPGLVLHGPDGYTAEAEAVLRHGAALVYEPPPRPHLNPERPRGQP